MQRIIAINSATEAVNKSPPIIVKSVEVVKAYTVRATTMEAVKIVTIRIVWGSYFAVVQLTK